MECDESDDFRTFRLGLFGLDKLQNIDRTVANFENALKKVLSDTNGRSFFAAAIRVKTPPKKAK